MKNNITQIILLNVLLSISINIIAQDTTLQWNIGIYDNNIGPEHPLPFWHSEIYKTNSDTLIDGNSYKKLFVSSDSLFLDSSYFGGLRFDSSKMFLYKNTEEQLLFDFNLNPGDSIILCETETVIVDSVDLVNINGKYLKRIFVSNDIWIENIGSINFGLFTNLCSTGSQEQVFLCFKENNELLIQNNNFNSCFIDSTLTNIDDLKNNLITIYPNPTKNHIYIKINKYTPNNKYYVKIDNILGQNLYYNVITEQISYINISKIINNGIYLFYIIDYNSKIIIKKKIIIIN